MLPAPPGSICQAEPCSLHLHGATTNIAGRVYSAPDAPGLIMGTGNVGVELSMEFSSTYFSRDLGWSWAKVRNGTTTFEFGNKGAIMLLATPGQQSTVASYSWNQGLSWVDCNYTSSPIAVDDVVVDASLVSRVGVFSFLFHQRFLM